MSIKSGDLSTWFCLQRLQHNTYKYNLSSKSLKTRTQKLAASIYKPFHPFLKASLSLLYQWQGQTIPTLSWTRTNKPNLPSDKSLSNKSKASSFSLSIKPWLSSIHLYLAYSWLSLKHSPLATASDIRAHIVPRVSLPTKSSPPLSYDTSTLYY